MFSAYEKEKSEYDQEIPQSHTADLSALFSLHIAPYDAPTDM